jgi:methyl-accepting chemotaxis protein PixJ
MTLNQNFPDSKVATNLEIFSSSGNTLRRRLLVTILPTVLVPLAIASAIGFNTTQRRSTENSLTKLQENALLTSEASRNYIEKMFRAPELVSINPQVISALRTRAKQAELAGLPNRSTKQLEAEFANTKLLTVDPELNQYMESVAKKGRLAEVFFTERNGFNIAFSNLTSDFVQKGEEWWEGAKADGLYMEAPEFDESAKAVIVPLAEAIKDIKTGEFLGVVKAAAPVTGLNEMIQNNVGEDFEGSQQIQTIDSKSGTTINTITAEGMASEQREVLGGKVITQAAQLLYKLQSQPDQSTEQPRQELEKLSGISNVTLQRFNDHIGKPITAQLGYQGRIFSLSTVPNTKWVAIASIDEADISAAGRELLSVFGLTALALGIGATGLILLLARNLSKPLGNLTQTAQVVAEGNLDAQAELMGTVEVQTLALTFNNLVSRVKTLIQEQKVITGEQREQRESLENSIVQLVSEVESAMDGDLTVRANLNSLEMSTVADIFNAIIHNLRDIAIQVRESAGQVSASLGSNEKSMRQLSEKAIAEAGEIRGTLNSMQEMTDSIEEVATSANQASAIANDAYSTVQEGSEAMAQTVDSIVSLRTTVGETAKKMKRLGESSQKISQVVALIEEIALKTNLLAINASVEASRAGEQGQGFTVVAEQVGALAEQSVAATREIAKIVAAIQTETQDVAKFMELGTAQVVDSTRLVETTKQRLNQVLNKSQRINTLMGSISTATVSQAETSKIVTQLMRQVTQSSEERSLSSGEVAREIKETSQVAQELEAKVAQFRV